MLQAQFSHKARSPTAWQEEIITGLDSAKIAALPTQQYQELKQRQKQLFKQIRNTGEPWLVGEFLRMEDVLEKSRLHFYTLLEFGFALGQLGYGKDEVSRLLAHQNAYANLADRLLEARIVYLLELSRALPGAVLLHTAHPSVRIFHPEDWDAGTVRDAEKRIRLAPKAYGFGIDGRKLEMPDIPYPLSFSF